MQEGKHAEYAFISFDEQLLASVRLIQIQSAVSSDESLACYAGPGKCAVTLLVLKNATEVIELHYDRSVDMQGNAYYDAANHKE